MYELNQSPPPKRYSASRLNRVTRTINARRNAKQHTSLGGSIASSEGLQWVLGWHGRRTVPRYSGCSPACDVRRTAI